MIPFIRTSVVSLILLASLSLETKSFGTVVDKIVVRVNNAMITQSDIAQATHAFVLEINKIPDPVERKKKQGNLKNEVLNHLINEKILEQEIEKIKIEITDEEVDRALNNLAEQNQTTLEDLRNELAKKGIAFEVYKDQLRGDLKKNEFLKKTIYPRIRIADHDLEEYYKKQGEKFQGYEQIRFYEILITPESIPQGSTAQSFVEQLFMNLKRGGSFAEAAKKYSRGAFANKGGDSGLIDTSQMRPDLLNVLLNLKINEISQPMSTANGIFIFKVVEKKNPKSRPFEEVKEALRQRYIEERVDDELEHFVMEARSHSFIEIKP